MLNASQVAELYLIHNALAALHGRVYAISRDVQSRGLLAGNVLVAQSAITDALQKVTDVITAER